MSRLGKWDFAVTAALVVLAVPSVAMPARADSSDDAAIRAQATEYSKDFASGDAAALANMWTSDGVLTDSDGREFKGRADIQNLFTSHFKEFGAHPLEINIDSIKFPSSNTAIEEGTTRSMQDGIPLRLNRYMAFHTKENNQWHMAAVTETGWTPETSYDALKDLSWLVGKWSVKQPVESGIHFNATWVSNRNFIKCEFQEPVNAGSNVDPIKTTQIIGWDPIAKQVVSWLFDSSGGFGYGRWHKQGRSWIVNCNGVEQDGTIAKASYVWDPLDTNMFTWQSKARIHSGSHLPDTRSITVARDESAQ